MYIYIVISLLFDLLHLNNMHSNTHHDVTMGGHQDVSGLIRSIIPLLAVTFEDKDWMTCSRGLSMWGIPGVIVVAISCNIHMSRWLTCSPLVLKGILQRTPFRAADTEETAMVAMAQLCTSCVGLESKILVSTRHVSDRQG